MVSGAIAGGEGGAETHLVLEDAVERADSATAATPDAERLGVGEALRVRDLRLERLELAFGDVERRRLEAKGVEAYGRERQMQTDLKRPGRSLPRHSARRAFSVPSMCSQRRSMGGRTCVER